MTFRTHQPNRTIKEMFLMGTYGNVVGIDAFRDKRYLKSRMRPFGCAFREGTHTDVAVEFESGN